MKNEESMLDFSSNPKLMSQPETLCDLVKYQSNSSDYDKEVMKQIELKINFIKGKLATLNEKHASKSKNKTVLEIVLPKEALKKFKIGNKEKNLCSNLNSRLRKVKPDSLYSLSQEEVKMLYFKEVLDAKNAVKKSEELNGRLIKDNNEFQPQLPKFKVSHKSQINSGLSKINLTIKNSKLNVLISKEKSEDFFITHKHSNLPGIATSSQKVRFSLGENLKDRKTNTKSKLSTTTQFQTLNSEENRNFSSIQLPLINLKSTTTEVKKHKSSLKIRSIKLEDDCNNKLMEKTRNPSASKSEENMNFDSENSDLQSKNLDQLDSREIQNSNESAAANLKSHTISYCTKNSDNKNLDRESLIIADNLNEINLKTTNSSNFQNENETDIVYNLSNKAYEEKLENRLSILRSQLKELTNKYYYLCSGLERANRRFEEMILEKDALKNSILRSIKEYDTEEINRHQGSINLKATNLKLSSAQNLSYNEPTFESLAAKTKKKAVLRRMEDHDSHLAKEIINVNYIRSSMKQDVVKVELQIEKSNEEIKKVQDLLLIHYHDLLKEGKDTRGSGLIWIMMAIWNLGCEVFMSYMPKYLDHHLVSYLFKRCHKEVQLLNIKSLLKELRELVRAFRGKDYRRHKRSNIKKFNKYQVSN